MSENKIGVYWAIKTDLPKINPETGLQDGDKMEVNYYCNTFRHIPSGVVVNEWDTDGRYAMRFKTETAAVNHRNVALKDLDRLDIVNHPGNIAKLLKFKK